MDCDLREHGKAQPESVDFFQLASCSLNEKNNNDKNNNTWKKNVQPAGIEFQMRTSEIITGYTSRRQLVVLFPNMHMPPAFCIKHPDFFFLQPRTPLKPNLRLILIS